ncbi:MAG: PAS domain S-box protein [Desulfobacterota bacterium]|jgi:PAS domain S-box-containing protein|nr:PAS domain S-box protein [Thermodesulfobacteriota bacterium]
MNQAASPILTPADDGSFPLLIRRGTQSRVPLKVAIIGGGQACNDLLTLMMDERLGPLHIEILGVADPNPAALGMDHARRLGIFTTPDFLRLYDLPGLNLVIELTGSTQVREKMIRTKPIEISSIDHRGARLLWDLLQIEAEKQQLQREELLLEDEVRRHKEYLENIVSHTSDMIITTDLTGRIVTFNPGGERMLGYTEADLLGRDIGEIWEDPASRKKLGEAVRARGAVNNYQARLLSKDGQVIEISLSLALLRDRNGKVLGTVGISKDVTEENRLRLKLIENERLAAIGQTVAGLAHCLKNILNILKGGAYLVNSGLKREDWGTVTEGWQIVQKSMERINNFSLDMLSYCRERTPELVPTDPLQLLRDTAGLVSRTASAEGIVFHIEGEEGLTLLLDPTAMTRALLNLMLNAVDACREKRYRPPEIPQVDVSTRREGGQLIFLVQDNGSGMDQTVLDQLFTRFFSTKESRGTGLGLPVTQKIVDEHGGQLTVESRPGQGSTFRIRLPLRLDQPDIRETSKQ